MIANLYVSKDEIQKQRSPRELREYVENVEKAWKAADRNERECGILKKGLYRELINEVRPLSWVADLLYPETYSVEPVLGNQGYDAIVYDDTREEYEKIEMAFPHDGQEVHQDALLKVERGFGRVVCGNPSDEFNALFPFIEDTCKKKALKDYSDCTIVVFVSALPPIAGFEDQYEEQIKKTIGLLSGIKFKAKRVFLFFYPNRVMQLA